MKATCVLVILTVMLLTGACDNSSAPVSGASSASSSASLSEPSTEIDHGEFRYEPHPPPFPAARTVRLFINTDHREVNGKMEAVWLHPAGLELSSSQRQAFESTLRDKIIVRPPDYGLACYVPHHFFRYYDAEGRQIGEFAICFCCEGTDVMPRITEGMVGASEVDYGKLRALLVQWRLPVDVQCRS